MTTSGRPLRRVRRAVLSSAVLSAVAGASILVLPAFVLQVVADAVPAGSIEMLAVSAGTAVAALAVLGIVEFFRSLTLLKAGLWLDHSVAATFIEGGLKRGASADMLRNLVQSAEAARRALSCSGFAAALELPWVIAACGVIALFNPLLALVCLACVGSTFLICFGMAGRSRGAGADGDRARAWLEAVSSKAVGLAAIGSAHGVARRWELADRARAAGAYFLGRRRAASLAFASVLQMSAVVGVVSAGSYLAMTGDVSFAVVMAAALFVLRGQSQVRRVVGDAATLREGRAAWRVLLLAEKKQATDIPRKRVSEAASRGILSISYRDGDEVARTVPLRVSSGECLAVVGTRGAGKSHFVRALAGMTADASIAVMLDGEPIMSHQRGMSDRIVGFVGDQPDLFPGTVAQNICGFEADDKNGVDAAVMHAGVRQHFAPLPHGLDTDVGNLSFRQARAAAFVRALYGRPRLVVIDEPELGLDEAEIEHLAFTLETLLREGTTIVMATASPRLLRLTQRIVLMSNGVVGAVLPSQHITGNATPDLQTPMRAGRGA